MRSFVFFLPGFLFGVGLALAGLTNPQKITALLDVAGGAWDPSLLFVMGGAVSTFALLNRLIHRLPAPFLGGGFPGVRGPSTIDGRLVVGAAVFGVGWGLGGVCPGPAITDLSMFRSDVLAFTIAMVTAMVVAQAFFGADAPAKPPVAVAGQQRIER